MVSQFSPPKSVTEITLRIGMDKMDTFNRILKAQQEQREIQALKDKKVVEAMFANHMRPLNNSHLLKKADN
jgi:hypothetical protein